MKRFAAILLLFVLVSGPAFAQMKGKANVVTFGRRRGVGVDASQQRFRKSAPNVANKSPTAQWAVMDQQQLIPNRCVGLVGGDSFSALSSSSTCDSFAAPAVGTAPPEPPVGPARTPQDIASILADRAMALAADPVLRISPSAIGLTGLDSYFWLAREPRPIIATADVPGVAVTAEARPVRYSWDFGDGTTRSTTHIGRRWTRRRAGTIAHLYETSDTYTVRAAVVWVARWRLGAGPWQPLGSFTTTDSVEYPVRQIVALLVRPR